MEQTQDSSHRNLVMTTELKALVIAAAAIGFGHTLFGPDHYLPFIMMSTSRKWSLAKTTSVTLLCGIGHVFSSVVLGIIGIALGVTVNKLKMIEGYRGNLAAWALIAFGLAYLVWGLRNAYKNQPHEHFHTHAGNQTHAHHHMHTQEHAHIHEQKDKSSITPWALFIIFVLGPCEPLIPILMYPAARGSILDVVLVTAVFGFITIATMLGIVFVATLGVNFLPLARLQRYSHAIAGAAICLCGLAILFLGL